MTRHKWTFASRFRARAYGWRSSKLACQRLREAVSEIKKAARKDPVLGAEGAIKLMEKLWPALEHVDSSSGALGTAVAKAMDVLVQIIIDAPAGQEVRARWLDRLWQAHQDDGVSYLQELGDRWGEVCGSKELASKWADDLVGVVETAWADGPGAYFHGDTACLSCLLAAERYDDLLALLEKERRPWWHHRRYGVEALLTLGRKQEALRYAEECRGLNAPDGQIDRACEEILLSSGMEEEAYRRYGLSNRAGTSYLSWFRAVAKRYPNRDREQILKDLIEATPGEEGKWFATAKDLGFRGLALELAMRSPCEPKTLTRAARDHIDSDAHFAMGSALLALMWLIEGYGYEVTSVDVHAAYDLLVKAAEPDGKVEASKEKLRRWLDDHQGEPARWVRGILSRKLELP